MWRTLDWMGDVEIELFFDVWAGWMISDVESFRARKEIFGMNWMEFWMFWAS